ncbi:PREDICTED: Golgi integral membrane protein 4-like, partial [Tinamus guttatus]
QDVCEWEFAICADTRVRLLCLGVLGPNGSLIFSFFFFQQDSMNRYGALSSQHKILKNQHEDVKKQLLDLQLQHNSLKLEHRKTVETHNQKYAQLQQEKDSEVTNLQDTVFKLREESKLLRKAHQEVHSQLLSSQAQLEEFRQFKEVLQKMPSFKEVGAGKEQEQKEQPPVPGNSPSQLGWQKAFLVHQENLRAGSLQGAHVPGPLPQGQDLPGSASPRPRRDGLLTQAAPVRDARAAAPAWPPRPRDAPVIRFTRTVNSLPNGNPDVRMVLRVQGRSSKESKAPGLGLSDLKHPSASEKTRVSESQPLAGSKRVQVRSWQDVVNKVNAQLDEEQVNGYQKSLRFAPGPGEEMQKGSPQLPSWTQGAELQKAAQEGKKGRTEEEQELEMDAGMIEREENVHPQKEAVGQEAVVPDDAADPAQDPNNQGEDEFEEAELERPDLKEQDAGRPAKGREDPMDDYQEDQEQEIEDRGGEEDDNDDLEFVQERKDRAGIQGAAGKKDNYY